MSFISLFSGIYCNDKTITEHIQHHLNYRHINDHQVVQLASELSGIPEEKLQKAFSSKTSVFNNFTHEKECSIAYLRLALSRMLEKKNTLFSGYASLLLPLSFPSALRIGLTAQDDYRKKTAVDLDSLSEQESANRIKMDNTDRSAWTQQLYCVQAPWAPELYHLLIPIDQVGVSDACRRIEEKISKITVQNEQDAASQTQDFVLAANAAVAFANEGHNVGVTVYQNALTIHINHQVLMLNRLEEELKSIADNLTDITSTQILVGQSSDNFYRKHNAEQPSKVLLVDDEIEFVQTLSERLQMREMGAVVAFDGRSALNLVNNDDPEVMIIDLKMPGMDGMEILKQVKQIRPEIEIIVLTGHGSEQDRQDCMALGAFAYMQKPVDINLLSESLNQAHAKIKAGQ